MVGCVNFFDDFAMALYTCHKKGQDEPKFFRKIWTCVVRLATLISAVCLYIDHFSLLKFAIEKNVKFYKFLSI